jgi:hypothetical protein
MDTDYGLNAHDEIMAGIVVAGEMPTNRLVGDRQETAVRALDALDLGLLAQAATPLIGTRGLIAGLTRLTAFETTRIDIVVSTKERAKQSDLGFHRRPAMDKIVFLVQGNYLQASHLIEGSVPFH